MTVWVAIFKFYICKHKNGEVTTLVWHKTIQYTTPPTLLSFHCTMNIEYVGVVYRIALKIRGIQISFFSFSVYQNKNLRHETYVMMGVFSRVKWIEQQLNTQISWR